MSRARPVSRAAWFAFSASAFICGAVWFVTHQWQPMTPESDAEVTTLTAERDRLHGNDDQVRDTLREQRKALARQTWTPEAIAGLQQKLGVDWRWEWEPGGRPRRAVLNRTGPRLEEWPHYTALVTELGRQPGVAVDSVEFHTGGMARERRFTRVAIGLRFTVSDAPSSDGNRAAPSRGPPTVAPAEGPATTRKIGPVTSLRRPSASAEPPAPGQADASFRPDPPGPKAGASKTNPSTNPQEQIP